MSGARHHLYVHLPFCAHRCGYCDFVTAVGRRDEHARYVDALIAELELERRRARAAARDDLPRRRHADLHRAGRARAAARGAAGRGRGHGRGEPRDGHVRNWRVFCNGTVSIVCRSAHKASTCTFWTCWSGARVRKMFGMRSMFFVMPDSTTSRSTSSTGSRARAPPTSSATSPRPWRSSPSTCPRTSWRRSRARASRTRTAPSWNARPSRWSPTSSSSSRR